MESVGDVVAFTRAVVLTAYRTEIRYPAAALAYYGFVSFIPLLLLIVAALGDQLTAQLVHAAPAFLTPEVSALIDRSVQTASERIGAGLLAIFVLLWSGINVVGDVRAVVERIEGANGSGIRNWIRDAFAIIGSLGAAIVVITATTILFTFTPANLLSFLLAFTTLWIALSAALLPLYRLPSTVGDGGKASLPGAATTACCWTVIHTGIQFYAINAGQFSLYGVLSGVLVILTTLYLAAVTLFAGFIVNAQYNLTRPPL